jgi:hypothetical protein
MKNLFESSTVVELKERMNTLRPDSECVRGKMNAAQMLAHCSVGLEGAVGDRRPPRIFIGRLLGADREAGLPEGEANEAQFADGQELCG